MPLPTITHVNPLYEPSGARIPIPALSAHTPLFNDDTSPPVLAAQEELSPRSTRRKPLSYGRKVNFRSPSPTPSHTRRHRSEQPGSPRFIAHRTPTLRHRSEDPSSLRSIARRSPAPNSSHHSEPPRASDLDSLQGDIDEDIESVSDDSVMEPTIPKPAGEAGRPESGGYSLPDALRWSPSAFQSLRVCYISLDFHILTP
jgi:hypothetical protein